jgi:cytidylate kinase
LDERAKRRYLQLKNKGVNTSLEESRNQIRERDARDSTRDIAPLKIAPDALYIDSSDLSIDLVKKKILEHIRTDP